MSRDRVIQLLLGFTAILGIYGGYLVGASQTEKVYETMNTLLQSERDFEVSQNIKTLNSLREGRVENAGRSLEKQVKRTLDVWKVKSSTVEQARDYEQKHCDSSCLGADQ